MAKHQHRGITSQRRAAIALKYQPRQAEKLPALNIKIKVIVPYSCIENILKFILGDDGLECYAHHGESVGRKESMLYLVE